jgi:hypothetical protein
LGGPIDLNTKLFLRSPDSQVLTSRGGSITVNAPETNITGALTNLPDGYVDAGKLLRPTCAQRAPEQSTFTVGGGSGRLEEAIMGYLPAAYPGTAGEADPVKTAGRGCAL